MSGKKKELNKSQVDAIIFSPPYAESMNAKNPVSSWAEDVKLKWCERRPLISTDKTSISKAMKHLSKKNLTSFERTAIFLHELVNCQGLEFVAFSSAKFRKIVKLPKDVVLVPCFYPDTLGRSWKDPLTRLTLRMQARARFVYDGWIPISDWRIESVRQTIRKINQVLTIHALQHGIWFTWEPKYVPSLEFPSSHEIQDQHIREITDAIHYMESWTDEDLRAFYRSVTWLSQSLILPQPAARFLFCINAIESLANYIEKQAKEDSAFKQLRSSQLTKLERKENQEKCIKDTLDQLLATDPAKAITSAYSNCIKGIKKMLESHLRRIFPKNSEPIDLLFKTKIKGNTLYDLRHVIAHGGMDVLDDIERQRISERMYDIEKIARHYLINVLKIISNRSPFEQKMVKSMFIPILPIVSDEKQYKGPIHMAEFYA